MGRTGRAILAALTLLAAACNDPAALGPASTEEPEPTADEVVLGPATAASTTTPLPTSPPLPTLPAPPEPATVLAAGNLGACEKDHREVAAAIVADTGVIFALGDLSADGTVDSMRECFADIFEPAFDRIYAVPGDRDLATGDPAAFAEVAASTATGEVDQGWFVTSLGGWQIIGLNSRCEDVGGCDVDSVQYRWLDGLLRDEPAECRAVLWHDARFTSILGEADATDMGALVGRLDGAGVDVVLTGGAGNYERLGPLRPGGALAVDGEHGMLHFNIGSAGGLGFEQPAHPGSQASEGEANGYVRFVFSPEGYTWEFVATSEGHSDPDSGSGTC